MKSMKILKVAASMLTLVLAGCAGHTSYQGELTPLSPKPHGTRFYAPIAVDSLQPTFKWEAREPNRPVDLGIWQAVFLGKEGPAKVFGHPIEDHTSNYERGALVYRKENIIGGEHRIETNLAPSTIYFWSIKYTGTGAWSTATHSAVVTGPSTIYHEVAGGRFFTIKTPRLK